MHTQTHNLNNMLYAMCTATGEELSSQLLQTAWLEKLRFHSTSSLTWTVVIDSLQTILWTQPCNIQSVHVQHSYWKHEQTMLTVPPLLVN